MEKIEILDLIRKKSIRVTFEQLATVAREVLSVPASSTSSERVFFSHRLYTRRREVFLSS